jgi:hypothetical protein
MIAEGPESPTQETMVMAAICRGLAQVMYNELGAGSLPGRVRHRDVVNQLMMIMIPMYCIYNREMECKRFHQQPSADDISNPGCLGWHRITIRARVQRSSSPISCYLTQNYEDGTIASQPNSPRSWTYSRHSNQPSSRRHLMSPLYLSRPRRVSG